MFEQAQLAEAAYTNFISIGGSLITDDAGVIAALRNEDMSQSQAAEFVLDWRVVNHIPNTASGFSATVFESLDHPGEFSLAIRGSSQIADFVADAKRRLAKFNGVAKHTFYLHLKETEFRFNHRRDNLYLEILKMLRLNPL